jgi:hypothetical protein
MCGFVRVGERYVNVAHVVFASCDQTGCDTTSGYERAIVIRVELDTGHVLCHARFDDGDDRSAAACLEQLVTSFGEALDQTVRPIDGNETTHGDVGEPQELCGYLDWENNAPANDDEEDELSLHELGRQYSLLWPQIAAAVAQEDFATARCLTERRIDLASRMQALTE